MNAQQLKRLSRDELEALFADPRPVVIPQGYFRGVHLRRVDEPGRRRPLLPFTWAFGQTPFGVDFGRRDWTFIGTLIRMGRFTPLVERSRWRDTQVVALHYELSRLPLALRRMLYDEVVPLSDDLCLGIGGLKGPAGVGDHFFFALERVG